MATVFRKYRHGKKSSRYSCRYFDRARAVKVEKFLGVHDKQVAQSMADKLERETEREAEGLAAPRVQSKAAGVELVEHIREFLEDRATIGRDALYVTNLRGCLTTVCGACGWRHVRDITASAFEKWRAAQTGTSGKRLNAYLAAFSVFLAWMEKRGRIAFNPLRAVQKIDERGQRVYTRPAWGAEELGRLLAVAPLQRRCAYMLAIYAGLRRSEVEQLQWADVELTGEKPHVRVRACTAKNKRETYLPLHRDLVDALKELREKSGNGGQLVVGPLPRMKALADLDWKAAKIAYTDGQGMRADFHSLRTTCCSWLHAVGVGERVAQEIMRHSDPKLTAQTYTDTRLLNLQAAVERLPSVLVKGARNGALTPVHSGVLASSLVNEKATAAEAQAVAGETISHGESRSGTEKGWCALQDSNPVKMTIFVRKPLVQPH